MEFAALEAADVLPPVSPFETTLTVYQIFFKETAEDPHIHMKLTSPLFFSVPELASVTHVFICAVILAKSMHFAIQKLPRVGLSSTSRAILRLSIQFLVLTILLQLLLDAHTLIKARFVASLEVAFIFAAISVHLPSISLRFAILPVPCIIIRILFSDPMFHLSFSPDH